MEINQKNRWVLKPNVNSEIIQHLVTQLKIDSKIAQILALKGIHTFEDAHVFFRPRLEKLHDPFLMKDMAKAVNRILKAIRNQENIMIYGDYDVDGTTAVSMMYL
ncbi:MAG: single-stranded-DNA-specific exonuclease RecJ, partial [Flavobacteriales bacterium]